MGIIQKLALITAIINVCWCYPRPMWTSSTISSSSSISSSTTISNGQYKTSSGDSCHLRLDFTSSNYVDGSHDETVYAGNGFNYVINCHVNDAKMRAGDKYYVIDLIVYGPNQRVAKAWREQFTSANFVVNSKSFYLNKNLSFYWLGENNIVCAVNKYNSIQNKFTRICQNNITVDVKEKQHPISQIKPIRPDLDDDQEDNNIAIKSHKNEEYFNSKFFTTMRTTSSSTTTTTTSTESIEVAGASSNLSARALELAHEIVTRNLSSSSIIQSRPFNPIQPIFIGLIFLVIFLVSIGTIIYLSYTSHSGGDESPSESRIEQRSSGEYTAVKVTIDDDEDSDSRSSSNQHSSSKAAQSTTSASATSCDHSLTASSDNVDNVVYNSLVKKI